jgi:hypothetical protein
MARHFLKSRAGSTVETGLASRVNQLVLRRLLVLQGGLEFKFRLPHTTVRNEIPKNLKLSITVGLIVSHKTHSY